MLILPTKKILTHLKSIYINPTFTLFFIRKERIYTKLKYSRVPQFDTASGAIASLLAALLGFLITEKFGWELIDSGDFYTLFMYVVFFVLLAKIASKIFDIENNSLDVFSWKNFISFYLNGLELTLNFCIHVSKKLVKSIT